MTSAVIYNLHGDFVRTLAHILEEMLDTPNSRYAQLNDGVTRQQVEKLWTMWNHP